MENSLWILDQKQSDASDIYAPFALTDVLTEYAGENNQRIVHFWQLKKNFILGMKDTRVPDLKQGLAAITKNNYQAIVRNSGGLGVIADEGILNISLILPSTAQEKISIDFGYEEMLKLMTIAYGAYGNIEAKEITDSYCPGKYDLSIDQFKFAGIAQRRVKKGVAVMMYLSVSGDQNQRGEAVKQFYLSALKEAFGQDGYPAVNPASMKNLSELIKQDLSISKVKETITAAAAKLFQTESIPLTVNEFLKSNTQHTMMQSKIESMKQRNQILKELNYDHSL